MFVRKSNKIRSAITSAITAILAGSGAAYAQDQGAANQGSEVEEINITGSRIRATSGFTTPIPVTSMTTTELNDFAPGNTISQQLDALPQFFNTRTLQDTGNPGPNRSASGMNLRNLGRNRTLVLMDNYRVAPTDKESTVNVDALPTSLMRTVDVVTGGASAAYGADAVGGVVNLILDREFEGLKTRIGTGFYERTDGGKQWELEVAGGRSFLDGRLHMIGSVQSREISQVEGTSEVENFRRVGHVTNPEWVANPSRRGTMGTPQRLTLPDVVSTLTSPTGIITAPGTPLHRLQFNMDGTDVVQFKLGNVVSLPGEAGSSQTMSGGPEAELAYQAFNTSPEAAETIARSGFFGFKYDVNDRLALTLDGLVGRTEANVVNDRSGEYFVLAAPWNGIIAVDNAYLPEHVRQTMNQYGLREFVFNKLGSFPNRPAEGSNLQNHNVSTQWQWGVGFDYQIPGLEWALQGRWQRGEAKRIVANNNRMAADRMFLAMDAVRDPRTGAIVCRVQLFNPTVEQLRASVAGRESKIPLNPYLPQGQVGNTKPLESPIGLDNTIRDCVPYNVLGSGNVSPQAMEYMVRDKKGVGYVDQDFAELVLTGDLFNLPAGPVNFAAGVTWRDQQFIDGPITGENGVGVGGMVVTNEDLGPPLNAPNLGIRGISSGYTGGSANLSLFITIPYVGGQSDVWEWFTEVNAPLLDISLGGNWDQQVTLNVAYRESDYDRSGMSPSWKMGLDYQFHTDWRLRYTESQDVREPTFSELFDARGGGANINDPRFGGTTYQVTAATGGNLNLMPEEARTTTAGIVWQPTSIAMFDGLQISLDWWDTDITGQVAQLGAQRIVDECHFNNILCDQIERDPVNGTVTRVLNQFLNLAGAKATGTDLELSWRAEPNLFADESESLNIRWLASHLAESSNTPLGGVPFDIAGELNSPDYTHVLTANYGIGPWSFQLQNRFVNSMTYNAAWIEGIDVDDNTVASMSWLNARIGYQSELASGATWDIGLNIQNLFDQDPPVVPGFSQRGGTQSFPGVYDRFGRRYNLNLNYNF